MLYLADVPGRLYSSKGRLGQGREGETVVRREEYERIIINTEHHCFCL